jgi:hypothetical protein
MADRKFKDRETEPRFAGAPRGGGAGGGFGGRGGFQGGPGGFQGGMGGGYGGAPGGGRPQVYVSNVSTCDREARDMISD